MKFLHTMIRVLDLDAALRFFVDHLGLKLIRRKDYSEGRFSLVFLGPEEDQPILELTYNWDQEEPYSQGRFFGHLAFGVDNIYETCERLQSLGNIIHRPPRDGYMAFVKSPEGHSVELLQNGERLPIVEPWASMENQGSW